MLILLRGAGDIASGIAYRLKQSGFSVVMTDLDKPTSIRRTICFSEALVQGEVELEGIRARKAKDAVEAKAILSDGMIAVMADPEATCRTALRPDALVDAILAKKNLGTTMQDAPIVVGIGPGFTAGLDCHAVVETMRGHTMGRVYYTGCAIPNTGIPGEIGGYSLERILRAPCNGVFRGVHKIGDQVEPGEICAYVNDMPMKSKIRGTLRGILPDGTIVHKEMKSGDIDPRCKLEHCYSVSDKALAVGGGALEAILHFSRKAE